MQQYIVPLEQSVAAKGWSTSPVATLSAALGRLRESASRFASIRHDVLSREVSKAQAEAASAALHTVERGFAGETGLRSRSWYRTLIYAADIDNGYWSMVFPWVSDAIRYGSEAEASVWIADLTVRFESAVVAMERTSDALEISRR